MFYVVVIHLDFGLVRELDILKPCIFASAEYHELSR